MEIIEKVTYQFEGGTDVHYGNVHQKDNKGKYLRFSISNHLKEGVEYKFRYVCKCRAGFLNISEQTTTPEEFISSTYAFLDNVQVLKKYDDGSEHWFNVLTTKGGRFLSIDKAFLNNLKVTHMHNAWKKMVDFSLWKQVGAENHSHFAYKPNC